MKTFAEAAAMFIVEDARPIQEAVENTERYASIIEEAATNPRILAMCQAMLEDVTAGRVPFHVAVWTAFTHGLQIGIEMEKAE